MQECCRLLFDDFLTTLYIKKGDLDERGPILDSMKRNHVEHSHAVIQRKSALERTLGRKSYPGRLCRTKLRRATTRERERESSREASRSVIVVL